MILLSKMHQQSLLICNFMCLNLLRGLPEVQNCGTIGLLNADVDASEGRWMPSGWINIVWTSCSLVPT